MERGDHSSPSSFSSPSVLSVPEWDWDEPMTQEQLQEIDAIESAFRSKTSSSTTTSQEADDRPRVRRRLPDSIHAHHSPDAFKGGDFNSFSLSPCSTSRFSSILHSPYQGHDDVVCHVSRDSLAFPKGQTSPLYTNGLCCSTLRMERGDHSSPSSFSSPSVLSVPEWDWDEPMTQEQLQEINAIESAFRSKTSSSTTTSQEADDCPRVRRRLPDSIRAHHSPDAFKGGDFNSFSLSPCSTSRFSSILHSPYQENLKMRLPILNFGGCIVYCRSATEVEKATTELLKVVEAKRKEMEQAVLGFDIEWRPTFIRGASQRKAAVMQICGGNTHCYVMHIVHSGIPQNLKSLLEDPASIKVGVAIANDATKIFRDHSVSVRDLEDLSCLANQKLGGDSKKWSLASLTEMLISKQLRKTKKLRLGNWEANVLSKAQLEYAATDAFASWHLYEVLKSLPVTAEFKSEEQEAVSPE